jgi:8-oxo-dGTP pyrophosphatase MutT (NUDIX family)
LQDDIEQIMEHFKAFKKNVPVMGGILLDRTMQRVLLVKGWKNTACWGFPRGKIHKNETDAQCAVREVRHTALNSKCSLCADT